MFAYVPLIDATTFDGVQSDVMLGATGWLAVIIAVAGALLIIRILTR